MKHVLELFVWADITSFNNGGWLTLEDVEAADVAIVRTAGWVVKETQKRSRSKGNIWVVSTTTDDGGTGHLHVIPKGCILERHELVKKGEQ